MTRHYESAAVYAMFFFYFDIHKPSSSEEASRFEIPGRWLEGVLTIIKLMCDQFIALMIMLTTQHVHHIGARRCFVAYFGWYGMVSSQLIILQPK